MKRVMVQETSPHILLGGLSEVEISVWSGEVRAETATHVEVRKADRWRLLREFKWLPKKSNSVRVHPINEE